MYLYIVRHGHPVYGPKEMLTDVGRKQARALVPRMKRAGITLCVVSNSHKAKSPDFCKAHNIGCVTHSKKPTGRGIRRCLEKYGVPAFRAALAGDQIYTDVLGANCAGAMSILVKPIHLHNFWLKLRHTAEQPWIFLARKRRIRNHEKS